MLKMPNSFQMEALQATYGVQENGDSFVKKNQKGRSTGKAGFAQPAFNKESPTMGVYNHFKAHKADLPSERGRFRSKVSGMKERRKGRMEEGREGIVRRKRGRVYQNTLLSLFTLGLSLPC